MIADQTVAPEAQDPVSFIRRFEHHKREIARHRDALREILDGREPVIGSADRGSRRWMKQSRA
jgi:hypothetical protein